MPTNKATNSPKAGNIDNVPPTPDPDLKKRNQKHLTAAPSEQARSGGDNGTSTATHDPLPDPPNGGQGTAKPKQWDTRAQPTPPRPSPHAPPPPLHRRPPEEDLNLTLAILNEES
jgi:hypothetical protein